MIADIINNIDSSYDPVKSSFCVHILQSIGAIPKEDKMYSLSQVLERIDTVSTLLASLLAKGGQDLRQDRAALFLSSLNLLNTILSRFVAFDICNPFVFLCGRLSAVTLNDFVKQLTEINSEYSIDVLAVLQEINPMGLFNSRMVNSMCFTDTSITEYRGKLPTDKSAYNTEGVFALTDTSYFKKVLDRTPNNELFPVVINRNGKVYSKRLEQPNTFYKVIDGISLPVVVLDKEKI